MEDTLDLISEKNLKDKAEQLAIKKAIDSSLARANVDAEVQKTGPYIFTFDSGSTPAIKQLREHILLRSIGALNLQIDEIGSNLVSNVEALNSFLELYDKGKIKQKLIKTSSDNARTKDIDGCSPTNMLLFGTPTKLLDGGYVEDNFYSFLETGYARRCLFGFGKRDLTANATLTAAELFQKLTSPQNNAIIKKWSYQFWKLADPSKYKWRMYMEDATAIELVQYKMDCERAAELLPEHMAIKKAEMSHRYFKALKLAGALAFVAESEEITMDHLKQAIKLVEESGGSFDQILTRETSYMKLAKFIAQSGMELTHADLNEKLPYYKTGVAARTELMTMAIAWGYNHNIIIKKRVQEGVEFIKGETLQETDLNKCIVSYSTDFATGYQPDEAPFDQLYKMTQASGIHWCNHHFVDQHRKEENAIPKFNIVALDVDGTVSLQQAQELLKDYKYLMYTTKRHTATENRFRIVFPINYTLKMSSEEYRDFINNIIKWLPFDTDPGANQRARKWLSNDKGIYFYNNGKLLDATPFIPNTRKNDTFQKNYRKVENLDALGRWFVQRIEEGNRNNQLIKYALALKDSGLTLDQVIERVLGLNEQISNPLTRQELDNTIFKSVAKKFQNSSGLTT